MEEESGVRPLAMKECVVKAEIGFSTLETLSYETNYLAELQHVPGVVRVDGPCLALPDRVITFMRQAPNMFRPVLLAYYT